MTPAEFTTLARELIGARQDVAFRARPGPRAFRRRRDCTVVCVDLSSLTCAEDMRAGALKASQTPPVAPVSRSGRLSGIHGPERGR